MQNPSGTGTTITVFGVWGGIGKSVIAINLAVALAQQGRQRVALLDLHVRFGDVAILMDVPAERSIADLAVPADEITPALIKGCLYNHKTGIAILPAPIRPSDWRSVHASHADTVVTLLAQIYDYVIVDTGWPFNEIVGAALKLADTVLLVTAADAAILEHTRSALDMLRDWGYPHDRIRLVMNATNYATDFEPHGVEEILGQEVFWRLPYDRGISAMELGTPLVVSNPDSEAAKSIARLARLLAAGQIGSASEESAEAVQQAEASVREPEDWTVDDIWGEPVESPKPFVPALRMHREVVRAWIQLTEFPGFSWEDLFEDADTQDLTQDPQRHITFHDLVEGYAQNEADWSSAFEALMEEARAYQPTELAARHTAQHALIRIVLLILVGRVRPGHEAKWREADDWLRRCAERELPEALARIVRNPVSHDYTIVMRRPA